MTEFEVVTRQEAMSSSAAGRRHKSSKSMLGISKVWVLIRQAD